LGRNASTSRFEERLLPEFDPFPILSTLRRHEVDFVVVGMIAAIAQGYPMTTRDIDVTPSPEQGNVERLAGALQKLEAKLRTPKALIEFPVETAFLGSVDSWTLLTSKGELDILFRPAGTEGYPDLRRDAVEVELGGTPVLVASLRDVIRMKEALRRPKDEAQLPALRRTLEIQRKREA
jgi:hypothetical protein